MRMSRLNDFPDVDCDQLYDPLVAQMVKNVPAMQESDYAFSAGLPEV